MTRFAYLRSREMPEPVHRHLSSPWSFAAGWLLPLLSLALLLADPAILRAQQRSAINRVKRTESVRPVSLPGEGLASAPAELTRSTLTATEAAAPLHVDMVLKIRHFAELQRRVVAGETISRVEMAERYLPMESDYRTVAQWLTTQGLTVAAPGASHAVVSASGTPAQLQDAFQTSFARVAFRDAEYTAAVGSPSLPAEVEAHVASIHGLQPYLHPRKSGAPRKEAVTSSGAPPYLVGDILSAYNVAGSGLTGAGQAIGIVIDTVPRSTDLTAFWTANGVNQNLGNIITVNVDGTKLPTPDGEETLDVSWSSGIASGAQVIIYACGDLNNVNDCYSRILDDLQAGTQPNLHQISMSFGAGEETDETPDDISSVHQLFTAISAYGVSLFASAGDDGAYGGGNRTVQVVYPASDPTVTGVGGTTMYVNASTRAISSEVAWSSTGSGRATGSSGSGSGGGGTSTYFSRPSWQVGSTVPSGTMRLVPDVAFRRRPEHGLLPRSEWKSRSIRRHELGVAQLGRPLRAAQSGSRRKGTRCPRSV